ncbi:sugar 3,4-ketoisomerase [Spirosoma panaciterrae]|uniref:sugar 3,4-ketoisomerase n=1 Tax=Spirosoma panaciterrae TaxID=496058 RepID=UPI00035C4501|nr:FdtA/QdtA family cupin domain-containing protein [Spirosoma panaciterrae]
MAKLIIHQAIENLDWLRSHWGSDIKRIFFIYDTPATTVRGFHRHKTCRMVLTCLTGSVQIYIQNSEMDQHFRLDSPTQTLLVEPTDWRVMHNFSADAMLLVFADQIYVDTTYIEVPYRCCQYYALSYLEIEGL